MRLTDMADELYAAAADLPGGVRTATARRGGVMVTRVEIAREHLGKSLEVKGPHVGILEMRRHLTNYFKGLPDFKATRLKLVTSLDPDELYSTLDFIAERWGDFDVSGTVPAPLSHDL